MPQIGVEVVDVWERQETVQGRVDGGVDGVVAEGAERVHVDHFIFKVNAAVGGFESQQLVKIEGGESGTLDAAEVPATSLHPQNFLGFPVERIDLFKLGAGIATAEVGDAQIGTEQVGAIPEQLRIVEGCRNRFIPPVLKKPKACMRCHLELSAV